MTKSGIKILADTPGSGSELNKGDRVRLRYDVMLSRGDMLSPDQETILTIGDRHTIAGLNYGLEGMRAGGTRQFKASPHLCYGDEGVAGMIPKNAVLIFNIKHLEILEMPAETSR